MPAAHGPPVSAKRVLEMGGWMKSPLCAMGGDNVHDGPRFHYGDISRSALGYREKCRFSAEFVA